jgi:uncharacterized membrane protein
MTSCPQCGAELPAEIAFCTKCGLRMFVGSPEPGVQPRLQDHLLGAVAYFTFIPAIILLVFEPFKRNRYVRFHAWQSIYLAVGVVVLGIALRLLVAVFGLLPWVGFFLAWLVTVISALAVFMLWLVLVVKALLGEKFQVPLIGGLAEARANRS